jgi:hypothetical protein
MQAGSRPVLLRFVLQICKEIRAVTKPEKVFTLLVFIAGMIFQGIRAGLSVDLKNTGIALAFSALWAICIFGSWLGFKAARILRREDLDAFDAYKPTLHYVGDPPERKRPSAWFAYTAPTIMGVVFLVVIVLSIPYVPTSTMHRYFPWMPLNGVGLKEDQHAASIVISFVVRDERPNNPGGSSVSLPNNPLNNARLLIALQY